MSQIRRLTADYYSRSLAQHGDTPQGVDWKDSAGQELRFERLVQNLPLDSNFSILDVGCGTGALVDFLSARISTTFRYQGIDLVAAMIETARVKHQKAPQLRFLTQELSDVRENFDFVVSSGIFNVKQSVSEPEWISHCTSTMSQMFELCRRAVAFNFLTSEVDFRRDDLFYSDPALMLRFCQQHLSRQLKLDHAYPLYEYTLTVYRAAP